MKALKNIKPPASGWLLFGLMLSPLFLIGLVCYFVISNTPPEEKASNKLLFEQKKILAQEMWQQQKEQEEENRLDIEGRIIQPNEKLPVYDNKKYRLMKIDYRYFLVPREYVGNFSFYFFWPAELQEEYSKAVYKNSEDIKKRTKAQVTVFFKSKYEIYNDVNLPLIDEICHRKVYDSASFWNGIVIGISFDRQSYSHEWPAICQETLRILNLVREVKP